MFDRNGWFWVWDFLWISFCFVLFAGKILLILLAFHLLCCFLYLFLLHHLLCARRHVINASPISQFPSGLFRSFFSVVDLFVWKKLHCFRVGGVCVFFCCCCWCCFKRRLISQAFRVMVVIFRFAVLFFLYFSAIFSWFMMFSRSLSLLVFLWCCFRCMIFVCFHLFFLLLLLLLLLLAR